jgi:hypothetical protein
VDTWIRGYVVQTTTTRRASPRLVAHLRLAHDVAFRLTARLDAVWSTLNYDRTAVRMGAALHDSGKTVDPDE